MLKDCEGVLEKRTRVLKKMEAKNKLSLARFDWRHKVSIYKLKLGLLGIFKGL